MRTCREYYPEKPIVYACELGKCPECNEAMQVAYTSGAKTVQTMAGVLTIAQQAKCCPNEDCGRRGKPCKSARWERMAPYHCTYGYDVIAQIGWLRQTHYERFAAIWSILRPRLQISEAEVRHLYHERYLPLLACHERGYGEYLQQVSKQIGLILSLDGLAPEGGEPQLWVVRELQTGLTLRSGWLSQQDESTFVNFLQPLAEAKLRVVAVISDKQRGLEPAIPSVFRDAKHALCQSHYLKNAAAPVAEVDEAMKVNLRQTVRAEVGALIRCEKVENPGVLTVTGLLPSPVSQPTADEVQPACLPGQPALPEQAAIVQDLLRRVRYLLTLKGRPPFRLAGLEMVERLTQVKTCLDTLLDHRTDPRLVTLGHGVQTALLAVQTDYLEVRQAANWLEHIGYILDPEDKPNRSGAEVRQALFAYLDDVQSESQASPRLRILAQKIHQTSLNYTPGLFHCYDVPGLPRTNNDRESESRDLNHRLLSTTGQKGLVKRILQREGAWEMLPRPASLPDTVNALSQVNPQDFSQERQRLRDHRSRFRLHTRSAKRSQAQLKRLELRWKALPPTDTS
jgi:hypothetical protein